MYKSLQKCGDFSFLLYRMLAADSENNPKQLPHNNDGVVRIIEVISEIDE